MRWSKAAALTLAVAPLGCTLLESRQSLLSPIVGGGDDASAEMLDASAEMRDTSNDGAGVGDADDASVAIDASTLSDAQAPPERSATADVIPATDADSIEASGSDVDSGFAAPQGPVVLYSGLNAPLGITLFGTDICWVGNKTAPHGLFCAPSTSRGQIRNLDDICDLTYLQDAFDLLVDKDNVYWSTGTNNQVVRKPLASIKGSAAAYFTGGGSLSFLAFEGLTKIVATGSTLGEVLVGPNGRSSNAIYTGQQGVSGVAVSGGFVYWGPSTGVASGPVGGALKIDRIPSPGGPVMGVAVDAQETVYFIAADQKVYEFPRGAMSATVLYDATTDAGKTRMGDVAVDDTYVYFSEPDLGQIMRVPK
jgi:hypothetical protein